MKLLTKAIEKKIPALGAQEGLGDETVVHVKLFNPVGAGTWYAAEYDPETETFFGLADLYGNGGELGYFSLAEMKAVRLPFGLGIERDRSFKAKTLGEIRAAV